MSHNLLFLAILVLFDGAAVAWAMWEFWSVRARKDESTDTATNEDPDTAHSREGGNPDGSSTVAEAATGSPPSRG